MTSLKFGYVALTIIQTNDDVHWFNCWKSAAFFEKAAAIWYGGGTGGTSFAFGGWTCIWSIGVIATHSELLRFYNFCRVRLWVLFWFPSRIHVICYCRGLGNILGCGITNIFCFPDIWTLLLREYRLICFVRRLFWHGLLRSDVRRTTVFIHFWSMTFSRWKRRMWTLQEKKLSIILNAFDRSCR